MSEIYLVVANAGSYSNEDVDSWVVCAYIDLALAEQHARKAQAQWRRIDRMVDMWRALRMHNSPPRPTTWLSALGDPRDGANPYDPYMRYNGIIRYEVDCVPLLSQVIKIKA